MNTECRLARIAQDRMPAPRDGDINEWWFDMVNAWFLCDLIRMRNTALEDPINVRRVLSTSIVWG